MPYVPLLLENAELGPHGGVARGVRKRLMNFGGCRPPLLVQDIHDLALAPAEDVMLFICCFHSIMLLK